jgi:tRNA (adenine57-N1/adenine58-N1)-methyltransferase
VTERPFAAGERVVFIDQRDRSYLVTLLAGGTFHTHSGSLRHDEVIGAPQGTTLTTTSGMVLVAFRPRFADFVIKMKRGAQVIYPKDLGPIITYADIHPGARVIEAGTGSGALSIALVRAVGAAGRVVSYEVRDEHREQAERNVEAFFGRMPANLELRAGRLEEVADAGDRFDRCVVDLPEPWAPLEALRSVMEPGAVLVAYVPTTIQVQRFVLALPEAGFHHGETFEVLRRGWHVTERSVRPDHRMVGHTGFLSVARRLA